MEASPPGLCHVLEEKRRKDDENSAENCEQAAFHARSVKNEN